MPDAGFPTTGSDKETLFDYQKYENETITQEFEMDGHKNLIIIIPSNSGENTLIHDSAETDDLSNGVGGVDGILAENKTTGAANVKYIYYDYGSAASREIFVNAEIRNLGTDASVYAIDVETATTKPTWTVKGTINGTSSTAFGSQPSFPYDSGIVIAAHSFRYLRLKTYRVSGGPSDFAGFGLGQVCITDLYDLVSSPSANTPNAILTFEVKDELTGDWLTLISATVSMGGVTVTYGEGTLAKAGYDGDPTAANYIILPDVAGTLRAKMVINEGIKTGLSVIKV